MRLRLNRLRQAPRPVIEGSVIAALVFGASAICTGTLLWQAIAAQQALTQDELQRLARQAAALVDVEAHGKLRAPDQMETPEYDRALQPLIDFHRAVPSLRYVYTAIPDGPTARFVLDTATRPEQLGFDRSFTPSALMDLYQTPDPLLLKALRDGTVEANKEPYADEFGSFVSGFAPLFDTDHRVVGVVGVDLDASSFAERLAPLQRTAATAIVMAFSIACLTGWGVTRFRMAVLRREQQRRGAEASKQEAERANRRLSQQLRVLETAAQVNHLLLAERHLDAALTAGFSLLGTATGASRISFLETTANASGAPAALRLHNDWRTTPMTSPALEVKRHDFLDWAMNTHAEETLLRTDDVPEPHQAVLRATGVASTLLLPIHLDGACAGLLILESSNSGDSWSAEDRAVLRSLSSSIG
ncbi:MAG TPA: GAF domain-containing protein, partial [Candidatus Synoicihabitans sp.]|nr:GAF domain-containing protein [Candidatus Synoicihabitans sp.]